MIKKIEYNIYFRPQLLITDFIPSFLINTYSKWNGAFEKLAASSSFLTAELCLDKSTVGAKTNKLKESDKVIGASRYRDRQKEWDELPFVVVF